MPELAGLKVCFIAGTLGQGGSERQLYYMVHALQEHGAEPRVLCLTQGEFWETRIRQLGVPVTWVGGARLRIRRLSRIMTELRADPPDVLQSQHFYTNMYVTAAARLLRLREIGALRSDGINEIGANRRLLGRLSLHAPRVVAANSRTGIENAVMLGMPRSRLRFLPNVVDTSEFTSRPRAASETVRLLTVGSMVEVKRFDRFLRLLAHVCPCSRTPVRGVIVGDGPQRSELESQAAALALVPDWLEFHSVKAEMAPLYHDADVLILTSDREGTPNVVLEAMASGLPVVATRVGGLPDIVRDGETGRLVEPNDEMALAEAVLELVRDCDMRKTYGRRAREFVERYHALPRLASELGRLYGEALDRSRKVAGAATAQVLRPFGDRLLIVTHVPHYRHDGRLHAYAPYAREVALWADLFAQILIAAPTRREAPPGDCLELPRANITLAPQPERGGPTIRAKLAQLATLPDSIWHLSAAMAAADAIHVRCPGNLGLLGLILSPLFARRRVAKYAGQWSPYPGEPWSVRLQRAILRSRWWGGPVLVYGGRGGDPPHVVPCFTSMLSTAQMERAKTAVGRRKLGRPLRVLYVGRLSASKNVNVLLTSVATLRREGLDVLCTIVGDGPERSRLMGFAASFGVSDHVEFAGPVSFDRVLDYYERSDVLVLPSDTEGWPKTIAEGMAFGLICIGSNRGIVPEMLGDGRGLIVPPRDAEALAAALRRIMKAPPQGEAMQLRASAWAQRFTLEEFGEAVHDVLACHWIDRRRAPLPHVWPLRKDEPRTHQIAVAHLTDTLDIGGAERMAVNLINGISRARFTPHLCTTRRLGPLADSVAADVRQLCLDRRHKLDIRALRRLIAYIREHRIDILHAHGTAVFAAVTAALFAPHPAVIWHIHYGRYAAEQHSSFLYRLIARRVSQTITVSEPLANWAASRVGIPAGRVTYIPNFASLSDRNGTPVDLPGQSGERIVCVANFLPEKDHLTLLRAIEQVVEERPTAHLLLVGGGNNSAQELAVRHEIRARRLSDHVSLLGQRRDVPSILRAADIGVLSSTAEGLPLALIEYGEAALPAVATRVGQCEDVIGGGEAGILVPPNAPDALAEALLQLLSSPERRAQLGNALHKRVRMRFTADRVIDDVCAVYDRALV